MREKDKYIRIKLETWKELRQLFKAKPNESAAAYIDRLVNETIIWSIAENRK